MAALAAPEDLQARSYRRPGTWRQAGGGATGEAAAGV